MKPLDNINCEFNETVSCVNAQCTPSSFSGSITRSKSAKSRTEQRSMMNPRMMQLVPVNFLLKYDPPRIGIKYVDPQKPEKYKVKKITLAHLKKEGVDPDRVVSDLFRCHPKYFNKKHTKKEQVKELVEKLIAYHSKQRSTKTVAAILEKSSNKKAPLHSSRIPSSVNTPIRNVPTTTEIRRSYTSQSKQESEKSRSLNKLREAIRCGGANPNISANLSFNGKRRQKLETKGLISCKDALKLRDKVGTKMTSKEIELLRGRIYRELKFMNKYKSKRNDNNDVAKQLEFNTTSTEESESTVSDKQNLKSFTDSKIEINKYCVSPEVDHRALNLTSKFKMRRLKTSIDTNNPIDCSKQGKLKKIKKSNIVFIMREKTRTRTSQEL